MHLVRLVLKVQLAQQVQMVPLDLQGRMATQVKLEYQDLPGMPERRAFQALPVPTVLPAQQAKLVLMGPMAQLVLQALQELPV